VRIIETTATILPDGTVSVDQRIDLPPGRYSVVLVLDKEPDTEPARSRDLDLRAWAWGSWPADSTFRREDLYGDDGR
jgi:hypothetical protein